MACCPRCGNDLERTFRFCPWCGEAQRRKLVEFFRAHPRDAGRALRVSRYFGDEPQVRFSVWDQSGVANAAVSLDETEALRLAQFLTATQPRRARLRERLRTLVH
jgi:predicted amidophosphoribosyltransferase